jgi:GntR family transcriptional regulator
MDQVTHGIASGLLAVGNQLPTVRQLAVDLSVNPNTVIRAYRELEIRGVIDTHQGSGTFVRQTGAEGQQDDERQKRLAQFARDMVARTGLNGFTLDELMEQFEALRTAAREKGDEYRNVD